VSILLSGYYPEGIVFAADKNATITHLSENMQKRYVESSATKVLCWPHCKAIVGFVGLGTLAGLDLDEWMRTFIAGHRDFDDIDSLANELKGTIQHDFDIDYSEGTDISEAHLVIHLGAFDMKQGIPVPVMYHIWNHGEIDGRTGDYPPAQRTFDLSEDVERDFMQCPSPEDYPQRVQQRLQRMVDERRYLWFSNGANIGAFQVFRDFIWHALYSIQDAGFAPKIEGLAARVAFCKMAVEVFGSYFTHHYDPNERIVGGGVDVVSIPWPEIEANT
jgi:hypothetical protein